MRYVPHILAIVLFIGLATVLRHNLLDIPLQRDEGAYAYLGREALAGGAPYLDFYEIKPPAMFYTYGLLTGVFGYDTRGLHTALIWISIATAGLLYAFVYRYSGRTAALFAGVIYLFLNAGMYITGFAMQLEQLVNLFGVGGLTAYAFATGSRKKILLLSLSGACLAWAACIKQTGAAYGLAAALLILWRWIEQPASRKVLLREAAVFAAAGLVTVGVALLPVWLSGSWSEFIYWVFDRNRHSYLTSVSKEVGDEFFNKQFSRITGEFAAFWILAAAGMLLLLFQKKPWSARIWPWIFFGLCAYTITPGNRYLPHYWLTMLPAVALLAAQPLSMAADFMIRRFKATPSLAAPVALTVLIILYGSFSSWKYFFDTPPEATALRMYVTNPFIESRELSKLLNREMRPNDNLMVWGSEPQVYVYTNKKAPTRHFYTAFSSTPGPRGTEIQKEIMETIQADKPEYMIYFVHPFSWSMKPDSDTTLYQWAYRLCRDEYTVIGVADQIGRRRIVYKQHEEAAAYKPQGEKYTLVFKRKDLM